MKAVDEEGAASAVEEEGGNCEPRMPQGEDYEKRSGGAENGQVTDGLSEAFRVAFAVQLRENFFGKLWPVPADRGSE